MSRLTQQEKDLIKKYGHLFLNTGGNDIEEFILREDIDPFSNSIAYAMKISLTNQMQLLQRLKNDGHIS